MSQLVRRRISKLSSSFVELRFLSTAARPYLLLRDEIRALNLLDPCKQETVKIPKSTLSSPDKEYCVVVAKLNTQFINLCRPGDSEWTHIETPWNFFTSEVMYSVRDRIFYLYSSNVTPTHLIKTCSDFPPASLYQRFPFSDIPKSTEDLIQSAVFRNQYLVEAPTDDSFIVFWCNEDLKKETSRSRPRRETKAFMVFRQDPEQEICSYTQDIGDLTHLASSIPPLWLAPLHL